MSFEQKIRKLDVFKKVPADFSEGSSIGGVISLLTLAGVLAFLAVQLYGYINPGYTTIIMPMKQDFRRKMRVNIDILFTKLPCQLVTLQQQDAVLSYNMALNDVFKFIVDQEGTEIQQYQEPNKDQFDQDAYRKHLEDTKKVLREGLGCRVKGFFRVNEVPGIIRFSAEGSFELIAMLMAEGLLTRLDTSHRINYFSFGEPDDHQSILKQHPNASLNELSRVEKVFDVNWKARYMHYHLDVIPTYYFHGFASIDTYQYIWRFNEAVTDELPVVYFQYKIGGIAVEVNSNREVIWVFLMELCSVVGGAFAISSFFNNFLSSFESGRKGYELVQ